MKKLTFEGTFKTELLIDELLAAFPQWITPMGCVAILESGPGIIWLTCPDNTDENAVQVVIAAHNPNLPSQYEIMTQAQTESVNGYKTLSDWVKTGTATDAETYINDQIWNGLTLAQVNTYIDNTIVNITTANISQINAQLANIRTVFKAAAGAVIAMRGLFIITAKLLIYVRDLVIRFRRE